RQPAGRAVGGRADLVRVERPLRRRPAGPHATALVAADAGAGAGGVAADPVGAEIGRAVRALVAGPSDRFFPAAPGHALDRGDAVGVRVASLDTGVRLPVAVEGGADLRGARGAGAGPVAVAAPADRSAVAGPPLADGPLGIAPAPALAVAGAVEAAGRDRARRADVGSAGRAAGGHEGADTGRRGGVAGLAGLLAGALAADTVDAKTAAALGVAAASGAVRPVAGVAAGPAVTSPVGLVAAAPARAVATGDHQRRRQRGQEACGPVYSLRLKLDRAPADKLLKSPHRPRTISHHPPGWGVASGRGRRSPRGCSWRVRRPTCCRRTDPRRRDR